MTLTIELADTKEAVLKAKAQAQGVSAEQYIQQVLDRDLDPKINDLSHADERPIWEIITEIMKDVPDEVFDRLPKDGARQVDHSSMAFPRETSEPGFRGYVLLGCAHPSEGRKQ